MRSFTIYHKIIFFWFVLLAIASCKKDEDPAPTVNRFLVSYERVAIRTANWNQTLLGFVDNIAGVNELISQAHYDVDVYRVNYYTTYKDSKVTASGLVAVPVTEAPVSILSFQNGTNAKQSEAPSVDVDNLFFLLLQSVAGTGFIITIPDYIGFGSTSALFHPYYHAEEIIPSVLDLIRAADELAAEIHTQVSGNLYLMGYSEGGWSTLQAMSQIENNYPEEFNLQATVCGAGAYDLTFVNDYILAQETFLQPFYLPYVFLAYQSVGIITNTLTDIFKEPYASKIPELFSGELNGQQINSGLTTTMPELLTDDYQANRYSNTKFAKLANALENNSVQPWKLKTPLTLYHGSMDESVPFAVSELIRKKLLEAGTHESMVELVSVPGAGHDEAVLTMGVKGMLWFLEKENQKLQLVRR